MEVGALSEPGLALTHTSSSGAYSTRHFRPSFTILAETCPEEFEEADHLPSFRSDAPPTPEPKSRRAFYLDWMRIVAIYLVVSFHVVQALDWVGLWCGNQQLEDISFRCVALQIGMPLFFHISGRAQAMAKPVAFRRSFCSRFMRLIVPFLVCYALLIPPWLWIHMREDMTACQVQDGLQCHGGNTTFFIPSECYKTIWKPNTDVPQDLFVYLYKYWTFQQFTLDPGWLWFLPVLFFVTVSSTPLLLWGEHRRKRYLVVTVLWLVLQTLIVYSLPRGYKWCFPLFLAIGPLGAAIMVKVVPFPARSGSPETQRVRFLAICVVTALHVLASVGAVCSFSYHDIDGVRGYSQSALRAVPQMFFYPLFYTQGFFNERWWPEAISSKSLLQGTSVDASFNDGRLHVYLRLFSVLSMFAMFIVIFVGSPVGKWEFSSFPVYSSSFRNGEDLSAVGYVLGTWVWICIADALFQAYSDHEIHPWIHQHASASTIVVYIFHWAFIKPFVWFVIRDFSLMYGIWKFIAAVFTWAVGVGCSLGVYALLLRVPCLGRLFGL